MLNGTTLAALRAKNVLEDLSSSSGCEKKKITRIAIRSSTKKCWKVAPLT